MRRFLHITDDLLVPSDLVTQTIAYLAKKRVGKIGVESRVCRGG